MTKEKSVVKPRRSSSETAPWPKFRHCTLDGSTARTTRSLLLPPKRSSLRWQQRPRQLE